MLYMGGGNIGIMERNMETTGIIGVILGAILGCWVLGGSWDLVTGLIMRITGVIIWLIGVISILTKSP